MDTTTIQTWLSIIKDIVTIFAAGVAAYVGFRGLQTWQRQLRGNAEYELAKRVLTAVYRVRDSIIYFRFRGDWADDFEKLKEFHEIQFAKVQDARAALEVELLEAEAVWGEDENYKRSSTELMSLWVRLRFAYMAECFPNAIDPNAKEGNRQILFSSPTPGEDKFANDLERVVAEIEDLLRPKLLLKQVKRKKGHWWDRFKKQDGV